MPSCRPALRNDAICCTHSGHHSAMLRPFTNKGTNQRTLRITCWFSACLPALLLAPLINRLRLQPFENTDCFITFFLSFVLSVLAIMNSSNHPLWVQRAIVAPDHGDTHTLGRTPLDEGSARRRGLYLTTT